MERKDFLKLTGLASAAALFRGVPVARAMPAPTDVNTCTLVPQETAGPYPLDLHTNAAMIRQDIRESQQGAYYTFKVRIIDVNTCQGVPNARVDVWHCNYQGNYSGYNTNSGHGNGNVNAVGQTWLRGIQLTDADGWVTFVSVFPGWYTSRVWHIHFQVYLNSVSVATSQFTVPVAKKNQILSTVSPYSTYGADPQSLSSDNIFSDGYSLQMATLEDDGATGGYISEYTAAVNTQGITGLLKLEPETGGQFKLMQNYPNPFTTKTTVPFSLTNAAAVRLSIWDIAGRKAGDIALGRLAAGSHEVTVDLAALGLVTGDYYYDLLVENEHGRYHQAKRMTALR